MITIGYRVGRGTGLFGRMFIRIQGHCISQNFGYIFISPRFRQRPYQKYCIRPLFQNKLGQSMPSRHTASAIAIAIAGYIVSPIIGYVLGFIAGIIGLSRIVSGVHYISDVLFALFLSFLIYGFILLYFPLGG